MLNTCISLEGVNKSYRDWRGKRTPVLFDIDLSVAEGEAFGFVGPNGAGKSTTIKILTGGLFRDSGKALLFGKPVENPESRINVSYVPESPYLPDSLTPLEILKMGVKLHKVDLANIDTHCIQWLERFSIAHVARKPIRSFSKGMTQRTALAHALACQPKMLILDEPLSGLDPIGRKDVVDILMDFRRDGGTIFFSSHVLHDVERLADRFGLIHKGRLRVVQSPNDLIGVNGIVTIRSVGTAPVAGMTADVEGRWYSEVASDNIWPQLHALEIAGHRIVEIKPSLTLEQAFLRHIQAD